MPPVRLGLAGLGNMGLTHARNILAGKVGRLELTAVCDPGAETAGRVPGVPWFATADAMIASGLVDAVLIATPHDSHVPIGIAALRAGLHVLVEKPIAVHKADAARLIAAHRNPAQVFAAMFNQRTDPYYLALRRLLQSGDLGAVQRVSWTITDWFRSEAYYASSAWRATWAGEGGGVLLNQCPHNLDLLQWLFGMPVRVRAFCQFGRYHAIEVEDAVTAYLEYASGATAVFVASTGEAPGTNRLEIAADGGRIVYEGDRIDCRRNVVPASEYSRTTTQAFARPETTASTLTAPDHGGQHLAILDNFVAAILDGAPLIAPAAEGLRSVELANAMLLSAWSNRTIELPLSARAYVRRLRQRIAESRFQKKTGPAAAPDDFARSLAR